MMDRKPVQNKKSSIPKNKFEKLVHLVGFIIRIYHDVQKTCPKHVEFYSKNKFEKLVHLVGFIIRIYHDA